MESHRIAVGGIRSDSADIIRHTSLCFQEKSEINQKMTQLLAVSFKLLEMIFKV